MYLYVHLTTLNVDVMLVWG